MCRLIPRSPQVRMLASAADLANKDRKDSQGICFLGKVSSKRIWIDPGGVRSAGSVSCYLSPTLYHM